MNRPVKLERAPHLIEKMVESSDALVHREIYQQPATWLNTLERVNQYRDRDRAFLQLPAVISGAGTSAYAASAIAGAWPGAQAIPSTDLLMDAAQLLPRNGLLVSVARSGNSPETMGVVESLQRQRPDVRHLAITCNADGRLAQAAGVECIVLDPRTNDRSLAMTSSFSNLVLAGLCLQHQDAISPVLKAICERVEAALAHFDRKAEEIARLAPSRICVLGSRELFGAACEASLKVLEMTAGTTVTMPETFLGLRHGPLAFLRPDTLVLCFFSSDRRRVRYELDLVTELSAKGLGRIAGIASPAVSADLLHDLVPANAPDLPDYLRTPFEIVFAQLLAFHLSVSSGLDPDNPSPGGVINRVVQGVSIYES